MSATHAAKLQEMLARWDELQKTEVTIEESGLCPQHAGINQGNADVRGGGPLPAGWPDSSNAGRLRGESRERALAAVDVSSAPAGFVHGARSNESGLHFNPPSFKTTAYRHQVLQLSRPRAAMRPPFR